jgi:hypothetical protein
MNGENTSQRDPLLHYVGMLDDTERYITGMEAAGQRQLVNSSVLPSEMRGGREAFEALGFVFGEPVDGDPLFIAATLPDGWEKRGSDHDMWSYIYDADGNQRVAVFYKAAFYDRKAAMHIVRPAD